MSVKELEAKLNRPLEPKAKRDLLEQIADCHYDLDNFPAALKFYGEAARLCSGRNSKAYCLGQKGICHYLLEEDDEAETALLESKKLSDPASSDFSPEVYGLVHYFLGSLYEYRGDSRTSLREREKAAEQLESLPPEAQWMLLAGMSRNHQDLGDHRRAVDCNTRALSLISKESPESAYLYESLGVNYCELGEYEEALAYFSRILEVAPDFERKDDVYLQIARCCKERLDHEMALDSYLKILELKQLGQGDDSLIWLYIEIASCLYHLKEYNRALAYIETALALPIPDGEELAELRSYLTNCHFGLGQYEQAAKEGEKTLSLRDRFRGLDLMLPNLALSYYNLEDKKNFLRCRERCVREFPDSGWSRQLSKLAV